MKNKVPQNTSTKAAAPLSKTGCIRDSLPKEKLHCDTVVKFLPQLKSSSPSSSPSLSPSSDVSSDVSLPSCIQNSLPKEKSHCNTVVKSLPQLQPSPPPSRVFLPASISQPTHASPRTSLSQNLSKISKIYPV